MEAAADRSANNRRAGPTPASLALRATRARPGGKLLAHRLKGYAARDHSRAAFAALGGHAVPFVEIDTRVCADGEIVVAHDPFFFCVRSRRRVRFASVRGERLRAVDGSGGPVSLDQGLTLFRMHARPDQVLWIDIKDVGFEQGHLALVRRHGLEGRTVFVSWAPQTILALHALEAAPPLFLGHWNLRGIGSAGRLVARLLARVRWRLGPYVLLGDARVHGCLGAWRHGFQHGLVSDGLDMRLVDVLRASGGGICVHTSVARPRLGTFCRENDLKLAVFNTADAAGYASWASRDHVDLVFCDDAPAAATALAPRLPLVGPDCPGGVRGGSGVSRGVSGAAV